jgi:hypothetical protein
MSKKDFKHLLWDAYILFCRGHPDQFGELPAGSASSAQVPDEVLRIPTTRGDMARRFNPQWSNEQVEAALAVEEHLIPKLQNEDLSMEIFEGDAGYFNHKPVPASIYSVCTV